MSPAAAKAKGKTALKPNREQGRRYVRSRHTKTEFEGGEFDGLWIRTRRITVRQLFAISRRAAELPADVEDMDPAQLDEAETLLGEFAEFLVEWNLDEPVLDGDGEETDDTIPVPATLDGLMTQDFPLVFTLFTRWIAGMGSVAAPLDQPSPGGGLSAVPPIPMDELSPSPPS